MFGPPDEQRRIRLALKRIGTARRQGEGVYFREWTDQPATPEALIESVISWCRETLGNSRRPWGIDHFDLALAFNDGAEPRSVSFQKLRPIELYVVDGADGLGERLHRMLTASLVTGAAGVPLAVALFSWGDAVHRAITQTS